MTSERTGPETLCLLGRTDIVEESPSLQCSPGPCGPQGPHTTGSTLPRLDGGVDLKDEGAEGWAPPVQVAWRGERETYSWSTH